MVCVIGCATWSQCSIPETCPNDLGFVDYELLITVLYSFNQRFLLLAATWTAENWLIFLCVLSHLWPCCYPRWKTNRLPYFSQHPFTSLQLDKTKGHCRQCQGWSLKRHWSFKSTMSNTFEWSNNVCSCNGGFYSLRVCQLCHCYWAHILVMVSAKWLMMTRFLLWLCNI